MRFAAAQDRTRTGDPWLDIKRRAGPGPRLMDVLLQRYFRNISLIRLGPKLAQGCIPGRAQVDKFLHGSIGINL